MIYKITNFTVSILYTMLRLKKHLQRKYHLAEADWDIIKEYFDPFPVRKNEYVVQKGKVCRRISFIAEGVLRYCMDQNGKDVTCFFISENCFAGDPDSFLAHKPSERNLQALTDCVLIGITYDNLQKLKKVYSRCQEIMGLIDHDVMMSLLNQRDFLQHANATTRYQKFMEYYPDILQRVPLSYVASFLGIKQQSLSRLRKKIS